MIHNTPQSTVTKSRSRRVTTLVILAVILIVGGYFILSHLNINPVNLFNTQSSDHSVSSRSTEELKKRAFTKLKTGDRQGAVADFQTALEQSKKNNNATEVRYFEQQIDFVNNSQQPDDKASSEPAPAVNLENNPDLITQ